MRNIKIISIVLIIIGFSCKNNTQVKVQEKQDQRIISAQKYSIHGNDSALMVLDSILNEPILENEIKAIAIFEKGSFYFFQARYNKALPFFEQALLEIQDNTSDKAVKKKAWFNSNIGFLYMDLGDFEKALEYHYKALEIGEQTQNEELISDSYQDIGNVYFVNGDLKKAKEQFLKSLKLASKAENQITIANSLGSLGLVATELLDYDSALVYFEKANSIHIDLKKERELSVGQNNIGLIYMYKGDFVKAHQYIQKSLDYRTAVNDMDGLVRSYSNLAFYFEGLNYPDSAKYYYKKSLNLSKQQGYKMHQKNANFYLSDLYLKELEFKVSLEHYKAAIAIQNELFNEKKAKDIANLEAEYLHDKKLLNLEKEKVKKDFALIIIISFSILLILFLLFFYQKRMKIQKQKMALNDINEAYLTSKLEMVELKTVSVERELKQKKQEIVDFSLYIKEKSRLMNKLEQTLNHQTNSNWSKLKVDIKQSMLDDKNFINLYQKMESINSEYFNEVKNFHPSLNKDELNLIGLLKINFSSKQIAEILSTTERAVEMKRYRLRKKMKMSSEDSLIDYLLSFGNH